MRRSFENWFWRRKKSGAGVDMVIVQRVKQRYQAQLLAMPNVVGVGVGYKSIGGEVAEDTLAIVVNVERKVDKAELSQQMILPEMLDGVPVDVVEVGTLNAF